jgi:ferredoxin
MRVVIDEGRCSGHGRCYTLAGRLFVDDDAGYGHVVGDGSFGPVDLAEAEHAVASCPESAIRIEGDVPTRA